MASRCAPSSATTPAGYETRAHVCTHTRVWPRLRLLPGDGMNMCSPQPNVCVHACACVSLSLSLSLCVCVCACARRRHHKSNGYTWSTLSRASRSCAASSRRGRTRRSCSRRPPRTVPRVLGHRVVAAPSGWPRSVLRTVRRRCLSCSASRAPPARRMSIQRTPPPWLTILRIHDTVCGSRRVWPTSKLSGPRYILRTYHQPLHDPPRTATTISHSHHHLAQPPPHPRRVHSAAPLLTCRASEHAEPPALTHRAFELVCW